MKFKALIVLLLLLSLTGSAQAQAPKATPLFVGIGTPDGSNEGDIYQWSSGTSLARKTTWGHNYAPIPSPTGEWVAYNSIAEFFVKARTSDTDLTAPVNTYVLNTATGKSRRVSVQPDNASIEAGSEAYVLRSTPSWSPDGRTLAWTEIAIDVAGNVNVSGEAEQLVIYNLDTDVRRVIVAELPNHNFVGNNPVLSDVAWGYPGIAVATHGPGDQRPDIVSLYDETGKLISRSDDLTDGSFSASQIIWIVADGKDYITSITGEYLIDPATGKTQDMNGTPEVYSPINPDGVSMFFGDKTVGEGNPVWLLAVNGIVKAELAASGRYYYQSGIAISDDGKSVAYIIFPGQGTAGGVYVYRTSATQIVSSSRYNATGLAWGPIAWRVRSTPPSAG